MTTIGFIGLGHMGHPMARNLLRAGFKVYGYDVKADAVQALIKDGAVKAESIASLAENSDFVITSVQTGDQASAICLNNDGLFSHMKSDALYIDCSSIDIATTHILHKEASKLRLSMIDAPVSGGVSGAEAGTLTFMVGGEEKDFKKAEPVLKAMGKKIVHAGKVGHGQAAKMCNNLLLAISMIGVSEAFTLADKLGLDQKTFFEISSNASGQCWAMTNYCPVPNIIDHVPANQKYKPGFMAKMMLKDLRLAQHAAESVSATIPLGAVSTELYELYVDQGFGETDFSGVINLIAHKL